MNQYEAICENYRPIQDGDDIVCGCYLLKADAPYGSCIFCERYSPNDLPVRPS